MQQWCFQIVQKQNINWKDYISNDFWQMAVDQKQLSKRNGMPFLTARCVSVEEMNCALNILSCLAFFGESLNSCCGINSFCILFKFLLCCYRWEHLFIITQWILRVLRWIGFFAVEPPKWRQLQLDTTLFAAYVSLTRIASMLANNSALLA